jgi:CO/xanthine dehydrogenase FAD-binding subunit
MASEIAIMRCMYLRPTRLTDALEVLAGERRVILAGGTDFYPARVGKRFDEKVLDISALGELRGIHTDRGSVRIGALATWSDVVEAPLPSALEALKLAARQIGGVQIQNAGTVVGNLCNASPAADGTPVLLALDAAVELTSFGAQRNVPLGDFILGSRRTACRPNELATAVIVPDWGTAARSTFVKLGARRYLVISIAMVAAVVSLADDGTIQRCGVAVGACAPVARRLAALEAALVGMRIAPGIGTAVRAEHLASLAPISDVRGTADYRRDAGLTLVQRALEQLAST